jgi:hypothetical protein
MDPATRTAQAAATTTATVQALVNAIHSSEPAASYSHRLSLPSFWIKIQLDAPHHRSRICRFQPLKGLGHQMDRAMVDMYGKV